MAYINLLPWREEVKKINQRKFITSLVAVGIGAFAIVFIIGQIYQQRINGQNTKNQYLSREIQKLDIRIGAIKLLNVKKKRLQNRIGVIEQLQRSRNVGTRVLDEVAKIVPAGVYLTKLEKKGNMLLLSGRSESNNHLANMIRNIENSPLLNDAVLESISTKDARSKLLSDFEMHVQIKGLNNQSSNKLSKGIK